MKRLQAIRSGAARQSSAKTDSLFVVKCSTVYTRGMLIALTRHHGFEVFSVRGAPKKNSLRGALRGDRAHFSNVVLRQYQDLASYAHSYLEVAIQRLILEKPGFAACVDEPLQAVRDLWQQ